MMYVACAGPYMGVKKKRIKHLEHEVEKRIFFLTGIVAVLIVLAVVFALYQK